MKKTLNRTERVVTSAHGVFTVKHCDKNKRKRIYLAHNSRLQTPPDREFKSAGAWENWSHYIHS